MPDGATVAIVRAYMAHHQGMTLIALGNVLHDGIMRARFHAEPIIQATDLLLQERAPRDVAVARPRLEEVDVPAHVREFVEPVFRRFTTPHGPAPRTHLLSNGRYAVMLTTAGSGYSRCAGLGVTRWREDVTRDPWGTYVFLRDVETGAVWSAAYQPTGVEPTVYRATFSEDRAEFYRLDGTIATALEVIVSPEDDAEIRRVSVTNLGDRVREIELTSYAELQLAAPAADSAHPAFSNLFVQTELLADLGALLATRRLRAPAETPVWAAHTVVVEGQPAGGAQYETDRARFLGRGRTIRTPMSVIDGRPLSNTAGSVLDPIFSLRRRIRLAPGECARLIFSTLVAASREAAVALADKYRDPATFERTVTLAWTQAQVQLHHLGIDPHEAHLFQDLASRILYSDPAMRSAPDVLRRNTAGPSTLWAHQISGDLPIVLVRIDEPEDRGIVRQLLRAHEYWRMKGLAVDLVILNEKAHSYVQEFQTSLEALVRTSQSAPRPERSETQGRVFILRKELLSSTDHAALQSAARAVLLSRHGTLAEQLARAESAPDAAALPAPRPARAAAAAHAPPPRFESEFFNGIGGFVDGGREYVTVLGEGQWAPAPWVNVIANPRFGFQVSESGAGYTWALNSRENQLTPWSNDAVGDPPGETFYVRDEETGALWGPTLLPIREDASPYIARHGQGYSRFEHASHGIALELLQFVPSEDPVKISRLTIENRSGKPRRLSVTAYVEWVLGASRSANAPSIVTEIDADTGALLARNAWNTDFAGCVAFADLGGRQTAWTADRAEVIGRNGTLDHPAMLERGTPPSGRVGAGLDPCAALQAVIELAPGGREEIVFLLGQGDTVEAARALIVRHRAADVDRHPEGRHDPVGRHARRHPGEDAGPVHGPDAEPVAALPDARLPGLGPLRLLSGRRRLRLPRPAPGRDGARGREARGGARASPPGRRPAVHRGRRPALVASALRQGRAHPDLRRFALATLRGHALPGDHRGYAAPGRARSVPGRPADPLRSGGRVLRAHRLRRARHALRALRACARPQPRGRRSRAAPDGHRRLERRHEPGGARGARRERLARLVPAHDPLGVRAPGRRPRRGRARRDVAGPRPRPQDGARAARLGWRLVSPRLLRRRHPARLHREPRVPHRFDRPVLGGPLGGRRARARGARDGRGGGVSRPARSGADPALHPAVRSLIARARVHQGLPARHPRERRAVHPRRHLDRDGLRGARATATAPTSCSPS